VEPVWLLLVFAGACVAFALRKANVQSWWPYVFLAGPFSWFGLILAQVHPALALVVIVPFMPSQHAEHVQTSGALSFARQKVQFIVDHLPKRNKNDGSVHAAHFVAALEGAPLHAFERHLKLPVDLGMFWFGLANAGVKVSALGGVTICVQVALIVGKTIGIVFFALAAEALGFGLPVGLSKVDLVSLSCLGGIGLTVALFVSNEAFPDPGLQSQAKMGAVISVLAAPIACIIKVVGYRVFPPEEHHDEDPDSKTDLEAGEDEDVDDLEDLEEEDDWLSDLAVEDIMQVLWTQRRYQARGTKMPISKVARSISKSSAAPPSGLSTPRASRVSRTSISWSREANTAWGIGAVSTPRPEGSQPGSRQGSRPGSRQESRQGSRPPSAGAPEVLITSNWHEPPDLPASPHSRK